MKWELSLSYSIWNNSIYTLFLINIYNKYFTWLLRYFGLCEFKCNSTHSTTTVITFKIAWTQLSIAQVDPGLASPRMVKMDEYDQVDH